MAEVDSEECPLALRSVLDVLDCSNMEWDMTSCAIGDQHGVLAHVDVDLASNKVFRIVFLGLIRHQSVHLLGLLLD